MSEEVTNLGGLADLRGFDSTPKRDTIPVQNMDKENLTN